MNIKFINILEIKKKFATLLSKLYHSASLSFENISDKIIDSPYFDFFERNDCDEFLNTSYEDICYVLFGCRFNKDVDDIGPVYWSGFQYMNIMMNCRIPLKTIFLLMPLNEMVTYYDKFHEMNEKQMCDLFMTVYKSKSIMRELRNRTNLSLRQLAELTVVDINNLKYFEKESTYVLRCPHLVVTELTRAFNCSDFLFQGKTRFLPLSYQLLEDKEFKKEVGLALQSLFISEPFNNIQFVFENKGNKPYLYIANDTSILAGVKRTMFVPNSVLFSIFYNSINRLTFKKKDYLYF